MATEGLPAQRGAIAQLRRGLMLADARRSVEDTTGSLLRAWWRVAIHPTPATFRVWGHRAGLRWIVASLITGSLLLGASAVIDAFHIANIGSDLNSQGRYLAHPTSELVLARAVANTSAVLPVTLAVLLALAVVTRGRGAGGLHASWDALLPSWALAHPALGATACINSAGMLALAAALQWMHATPPGPLAAMVLYLVSFPLWLVWAGAFLGYVLIMVLSAVWSVVPRPGAAAGWLAVCTYVAVGFPIGFALTFAAHSLGISGTLFGQ